MKHAWKLLVAMLCGAVFGAVSAAALADCETVEGRITSKLVPMFSTGENCPSPLGLCTEGRFTGDLEGRFTFSASTLVPYVFQDPSVPQDVAATTGVLNLEPDEFCEGSLTLSDTSAFSLSADGSVASLETIVAGTDECAAASGRIRIQGVFMEGCVDCEYVGEVCGVDDDDDDSDSDDDDSDN